MKKKTQKKAVSKKKVKTISTRYLNSHYGAHASELLTTAEFLEEIERDGGPRSYKILKELPTPEAFVKMRQGHFTRGIDTVISDSVSELDSLKDELQEWYDNLPESFQSGSKGDDLQSAVSELENISEPSVPTSILDLKLVVCCIPPEKISSRNGRRDDATGALQAVVDVLQSKIEELRDVGKKTKEEPSAKAKRELLMTDLDILLNEVTEIIDAGNNAEFPGMY